MMGETASDIMQDLALRYFDNRCEVTLERFKKRGFVIHHVREIKNDVLWKHYPKTEKGRQQYLTDLRPLVEKNPHRFALIKTGIHTKLDHYKNGVTRLDIEKRIRFCILALRTVHERKIKKKVKSYKRYHAKL